MTYRANVFQRTPVQQAHNKTFHPFLISNLLSVLKLSDIDFDLPEFFGHLAMVLVDLDRLLQRLTWQYWLVTGREKNIALRKNGEIFLEI